MIEYELSVNIKAENKEAIETLLITVESISTKKVDTSKEHIGKGNIGNVKIGAVELLCISGLSCANKARKGFVHEYEQDPWLSPLSIEKEL